MAPVAILCPIPHVQTMAIEGCGVDWDDPNRLLATHSGCSDHNPWPCLHTLYLDGGMFGIRVVRALAKARSVKRLYMYGAEVAECEPEMAEKARKQLNEIMAGVEDFGIYEFDKSPVRKWAFAS
ncbi:hypothetical protein FRC08_013760 [Ceratobasidium sp. 394]|nr:hypothetical protein FRC08_013760 [Ceratobasidium sp. 394]